MAKNYYEKIVINNGGIVGRCQECKKIDGLRFVTETRNLCASQPDSWQDVHTYKLCDRCATAEKRLFANNGAEVIDGRPVEYQNESIRG